MSPNVSGYDLIGDIHGHADALERLLAELGYSERHGLYSHPNRQVIFVGDFIDRGPKIFRVLQIVRRMVEAGTARAVLGNHELNAIAYQTRTAEFSSEFMRRRDEKNYSQHRETLNQLSAAELASAIEWFCTLPLWLDLGALRVVHACWDETRMKNISQYLSPGQPIDEAFIRRAFAREIPLYDDVEVITKGKEAELPKGICFIDKDGNRRSHIRIKWFMPSANQTLGSYAMQTDPIEGERPLDSFVLGGELEPNGYPKDSPPVFFGHYWLSAPRPQRLASNVVCLDYSVAKKGYLCAYRFDGEQEIDNDKFVWTD